MRDAMVCLQQELRGFMNGPDAASSGCQQVARFAFDSHPTCYTSGAVSFCDLKARDYLQLADLLEVEDTRFSRAGRHQIAQVAQLCLVRKRVSSAGKASRKARIMQQALKRLSRKLRGSGEPAPTSALNLVRTPPPGTLR